MLGPILFTVVYLCGIGVTASIVNRKERALDPATLDPASGLLAGVFWPVLLIPALAYCITEYIIGE